MAKKTGFSIMSALNAQSLAGDAHAANEFIVEDIPLEEIEPNADNFYNTEDIESLAADIRQNGLMHNVKVCSKGENGLYKLISGERRYRAFLLLKERGETGYDTIPATVDPETNPLLVRLKLISANASARVLSDCEKAEQAVQIEEIVKQLKQEGVNLPGRAREIAAQALGVSTAQAGRLTKIAHDLVPEVKAKFAAGEIGVTEAYDVATLPAEQQVQAVEARAEKESEDTPPFVTQADIDEVLLRGGKYVGSKERIALLYAKRPDAKEAAEALKAEWGISWGSHTLADGSSGILQTKSDGITLSKWDDDRKVTVSWKAAHKRMLELIADGRFVVTPEEAAEEHAESMPEQQEAEKPSAAPLPEPVPKASNKPPYIGTAVRVVPWADGLDDELTAAAECLEHWNEIAENKHGYSVCKGLILCEAAMRKKRTE